MLCWYSVGAGASQCVFGSYFYFVFVEVAQTPACQDIESCAVLCWYSVGAGASQCVFGSYFYFVFVEVAQTPACQDIESTGFLTRNRTVSSGPLCVCAGGFTNASASNNATTCVT